MSDGVAPSKGAMKAAEIIALHHPSATDKNWGGMVAAMAAIIDRETKSPQMYALLNQYRDQHDLCNEDDELGMCPCATCAGAERLLSELEVKP